MKKVIITLCLLALIGFSSCAKRYTCPTYLQNTEEDSKDQKVRNTPQEKEKTTQTRS